MITSTEASLTPSYPKLWIGALFAFLIAVAVSMRLLITAAGFPPPTFHNIVETPIDAIASIVATGFLYGARFCLAFCLLTVGFHAFRIHERFGIFKAAEPESHYWTSLRNWKVPFLWGFGLSFLWFLLQLDGYTLDVGQHPKPLLALPDRFVFLHSPNYLTDLLYTIVGFYLIDLTDWSAHRFNHSAPFLYNKFPFGHFVHHNNIFINPYVVASSPVIHFTSITAFTMYAILLSQGLLLPVFVIHHVKILANMMSHLGCDPLPGLTKLNYRVGGWIPWIPVHHQYHHVPGVKGNFGNLTSLWDHVFGTLSPEYKHHMETGFPKERVVSVMTNKNGAIDRMMRGKTRWNLKGAAA